jgi:hypothetical protein
MLESGMAQIKTPVWVVAFFLVQGFLVALSLQITLPDWASRLCFLAVLCSFSWFGFYRRRLAQPGA